MSRSFLFALIVACTLGAPRASFAQPKRKPASAPAPATSAPPSAAHVEAAERALDERRYADAIAAFVRADELERDMSLLVRAFEAAQVADEPLLIVQVAERILARPEVSDEGRTLARRAVARASDRLTQLELVCAERECAFEVDGEPAAEGISYRTPGAHELRLRGVPESAQQITCAARAICRFRLPNSEQAVQLAPAVAVLPLEAGGPAREPNDVDASWVERNATPLPHRSRGPMAVFVSSALGAAALGGLSVWSGMQAVRAKELHETDLARYDADAVRVHARRTDYYLLGAGICAATALVTAIWWVDWDERRSTRVSLQGVTGLTASHRF